MVEFVGQHSLVPVGHLPASGGTLADDLDHGFAVEACLLCKVQCCGQPLYLAGNGDLVAHLGHLASTAFTDAASHFGVASDDRLGRAIAVLRATEHDRQLPVFSTSMDTGNRCINITNASFCRYCVQFSCHRC